MLLLDSIELLLALWFAALVNTSRKAGKVSSAFNFQTSGGILLRSQEIEENLRTGRLGKGMLAIK